MQSPWGKTLNKNSTLADVPTITNRDVFCQFFEQTQIQVYRYIYGLTGGPPDEVEDLTAESYFRAWSARTSFRGDLKDAQYWIFKIAKHQVIDAYRRRKSAGETVSLEIHEPPSSEDTPEDQALSHERSVILWGLLQTLPESPLELIVLRYILGWSIGEIAIYTHKNETAVSMAVHRALKQLQQNWPKDELVLEPRSVLND
jgi:RNA polymerase sigma-70 factor (ECF subfamily)